MNKTDICNLVIGILLGIVFAVVCVTGHVVLAKYSWNWFIAPIFLLRDLTSFGAMCVGSAISIMTNARDEDLHRKVANLVEKRPEYEEDMLKTWMRTAAYPWVVFAVIGCLRWIQTTYDFALFQ